MCSLLLCFTVWGSVDTKTVNPSHLFILTIVLPESLYVNHGIDHAPLEHFPDCRNLLVLCIWAHGLPEKKYIIGILSFFIFIFNKSEFDNTSRPPPPPLLHGEKAHFYSIIQVSLSWCPFTMKKKPQLSEQKSGQYTLVHGTMDH